MTVSALNYLWNSKVVLRGAWLWGGFALLGGISLCMVSFVCVCVCVWGGGGRFVGVWGCGRSWGLGYLGPALVFVWGGALRGVFAFCFSGVFCVGGGGGGAGPCAMVLWQFGHFFGIS